MSSKRMNFWIPGFCLVAGAQGVQGVVGSKAQNKSETPISLRNVIQPAPTRSKAASKRATAMRPILCSTKAPLKKPAVQSIGHVAPSKKVSPSVTKERVVSAKKTKKQPSVQSSSQPTKQPVQPLLLPPPTQPQGQPVLPAQLQNPPASYQGTPTGNLTDTYNATQDGQVGRAEPQSGFAPAFPSSQPAGPTPFVPQGTPPSPFRPITPLVPVPPVPVNPLESQAQQLLFDLRGLYAVPLTSEQETAITAVYFFISSHVGSPALVATLSAESCREIAHLLEQFLHPDLIQSTPAPLMAQFQEFLRNNPNCRLIPQAQNAVTFVAQNLVSTDPSVQNAARQILRTYVQLCLDLVQRRYRTDLLNRLAMVQTQVLVALKRPLTDAQKETLKKERAALQKVYEGTIISDPMHIDAIIRTILEEVLGVNLTQQEIVPEIFWAFSLVASTLGTQDEALRLASSALLKTVWDELIRVP